MVRGFPTPDTQSGVVTYGCIPIFVPDNPEFQSAFASAIYGLYAEMSQEYFWRDTGTMTAQQAALLSAYGLAQTEAYAVCGEGVPMSCLDVADCIETDTTVQEKLAENFTDNATSGGYTPDKSTDLTTTPLPTLKASDKAKNLLPASLDCVTQPQIAMGLARAIVVEINQCVEDFFELIEYATNAAEGAAMAAEQVPLFGNAVSGAIEFIDWVLETMQENYQAAYNQATEDELACMIFCHIIDGDCTLSINDLISLYESKGTITVPPPDDIEAVLTFAIGLHETATIAAVAAFHYQILRLISWGEIAGFSAAYLQSVMQNNVSASDFSYEDLCDDCVTPEPTLYWKLYYDLRTGGQQNTEVSPYQSPNNGKWAGNGYTYNDASVTTQLIINAGIQDLGGSFVISAGGQRTVRRGSTGNGTHDTAVMAGFTGANYTGTAANLTAVGSINVDGNKIETGAVMPLATTEYRCLRFQHRLNKAVNYTGEKELRLYEIVVWGKAGAGDTKPTRAVWAGNTLPATVPELFPDYVAP